MKVTVWKWLLWVNRLRLSTSYHPEIRDKRRRCYSKESYSDCRRGGDKSRGHYFRFYRGVGPGVVRVNNFLLGEGGRGLLCSMPPSMRRNRLLAVLRSISSLSNVEIIYDSNTNQPRPKPLLLPRRRLLRKMPSTCPPKHPKSLSNYTLNQRC